MASSAVSAWSSSAHRGVCAAPRGPGTKDSSFSGYNPTGRNTYSTATVSLQTDTWHTTSDVLSTGDLRPDNFYTAGRAEELVAGLSQAFGDIGKEQQGSGASLSSNSTKLETGTVTYQAQFFSGVWRGELNAYAVDPNTGALSTSPIWSAGSHLPGWASRNIHFHYPAGTGSAAHPLFTWDTLDASQKTALASATIVNYLRGDRSQEIPTGTLRKRDGLIGDIVQSQPVYVGQPIAQIYSAGFTGASAYGAFVTDQSTRNAIIYVGANDGMLHGFNAGTGAETYAFIPNRVILNGLKTLSQPSYTHHYFVDGELTVADVYIGSAWKTVLIGTLGRGGPGLFALDVTDPNNVQFLWEKTATEIPALGRNLGKPVVAQVADGDWRVILGNGLDSADGKAQLVMVKINDGTVYTVDTTVGGANGLSAVYTWDTNADGFIDTAYAGDLKGNLWRFTGLSSTATILKLFEAKDATADTNPQPITAAPLIGRNPDTGERWVFFGTGQYLNEDDLGNKKIQTWYGLIDAGTLVTGRGELTARNILAEGTINGFGARVIDNAIAGDMTGKKGWFIDLVSPVNGAEGERMVVPNLFQGRVLIGTTRIPDSSDPCSPTGRCFVMAIDPFNGARLDRTFFDFTGDSLFNDSDKLAVNNKLEIVSGIGFGSGANNPILELN